MSRIEEIRAGIGDASRGRLVRREKESTGEIRQRLADRDRLREMESRGEVRLGSGRIPARFWTRPRPADPTGAVLAALLDERDEGR